METFRFRIIRAAADEVLDDMSHEKLLEMSDAIYEAGGDDASPGVSGGVVFVDCDREAESLREAIESAIADVECAGYHVARVEPEDRLVFEEINAKLTARQQS